MCGIAGYIDFNQNTSSETIAHMVQALNHRGPDDRGFEHYDNSWGTVGIGQARLSIIDISSAGHQPMHYNELSIVFNGEIYNFKEIRKDLEKSGHCFVSNSDTEVILHSYEQWGTEFVQRLVGMFVIAIYDKRRNKFLIFRDRAGIKPIFYYWYDNLFLFGSELKSLFVHTQFKKEIDNGVIGLFFDFGYIPAPYSIFRNTYKIEPGKFIEIDVKLRKLSQYSYWNIDDYYCKTKLRLDYFEAKEQVRDLLISSCNYRMIADVPVGIFLSGGYDSSVVTAILQKDRTEKLKTFTIGFEEGNNEAPFAKEVARHLGTDHSEFICTTKEAQNIVPELPYFYDEPFADSSAIPTMLVSKVARKAVKVALSADAGDELFAGYESYSKFSNNLAILNRLSLHGNFSLRLPLAFLSYLTPISKSELKHKLRSIANSMDQDKFKQATELSRVASSLPYFYKTKLFNNPIEEYQTKYDSDFSKFDNVLDLALAIDYEMYLQNDIMTKVDRASMSVSLEGREPLLDHRLTEFVIQLPIEYKFNNNGGKRILKDIVHDYVPKELVDRPKAGFSLPIYKWLLGDLRYLLDEYLSEKSISESGLFSVSFVTRQIDLFKKNRFYYKPIIWKLLMFQMWYLRWMK
jgi:asparagine synthase (glutamine-hydrolysing)